MNNYIISSFKFSGHSKSTSYKAATEVCHPVPTIRDYRRATN